MPIAGNISTITLPNGNTYSIGAQNASDIEVIAEEYDSQTAYAVNDYCSYDGKIYRCTTAITGESWNSSHWTEVTVMDEIITRCSILPAAGVSF